jgi:V/A-type H+-transporting ATPase subunit F
MEIAVVGTDDFTIGFELCGVHRIYRTMNGDYMQKFDEAFNAKDNGVIIVDEDDFSKLPPHIQKRVEKTLSPVVVPVSELGKGADIRALIKRCIGIDLWK